MGQRCAPPCGHLLRGTHISGPPFAPPTPNPVSGPLLQRCTPGQDGDSEQLLPTAPPHCRSPPCAVGAHPTLPSSSTGTHRGAAAPPGWVLQRRTLSVPPLLHCSERSHRRGTSLAGQQRSLKQNCQSKELVSLATGGDGSARFLAPAPRAKWVFGCLLAKGKESPWGGGGGGSPLTMYGVEGGVVGALNGAGGAAGRFHWSGLGAKFRWGWGRKRRVLCWEPTRSVWAVLGAECGSGGVGAASNPPHVVHCVQKWGGGCYGEPWSRGNCGTTLPLRVTDPRPASAFGAVGQVGLLTHRGSPGAVGWR